MNYELAMHFFVILYNYCIFIVLQWFVGLILHLMNAPLGFFLSTIKQSVKNTMSNSYIIWVTFYIWQCKHAMHFVYLVKDYSISNQLQFENYLLRLPRYTPVTEYKQDSVGLGSQRHPLGTEPKVAESRAI